MSTITDQLKEDLEKLKSDYAELDKEWDRLDSTGQAELQRQVAHKMIMLENRIKAIKELLGL